ncbi:MAG: hypothetical protein AB1490_15130 [Pseudomonadota bacterium]
MLHFRIAALAAVVAFAPASAQAARIEFNSRADAVDWIDSYRLKPEPARVPAAVHALSKEGALRDPEAAGFYVGFVAGVLNANPARADELIAKMLPLPDADQWLAVRAIAYSGLPDWRDLLRKYASRLPARKELIDRYLDGKLLTLDELELDKSPTWLEKIHIQMGGKPPAKEISYGGNPELLDTLWGRYFASYDRKAIWRILTILPWSKDSDSLERLTVGSAAKYTLANNAARYPDILALLKEKMPKQPEDVRKPLADIIKAAETMQTAQIRKEQLAAIDEFKRTGSGTKKNLKMWGYVGQGAIAIGCIAASAVSLTALGLPCVIGGAVTSAAINYWAAQ